MGYRYGFKSEAHAIAREVDIEITFQLSEVVGEHNTEGVGDDQVVHLHQGQKFLAVADDDNS